MQHMRRFRQKLSEIVRKIYEDKEARFSSEYMRFQERMIMLQVLDTQWKDHLWALDHLKEGIGLRGYGQRDPLIEYKKESFNMFEEIELQTRRGDDSLSSTSSSRSAEKNTKLGKGSARKRAAGRPERAESGL